MACCVVSYVELWYSINEKKKKKIEAILGTEEQSE